MPWIGILEPKKTRFQTWILKIETEVRKHLVRHLRYHQHLLARNTHLRCVFLASRITLCVVILREKDKLGIVNSSVQNTTSATLISLLRSPWTEICSFSRLISPSTSPSWRSCFSISPSWGFCSYSGFSTRSSPSTSTSPCLLPSTCFCFSCPETWIALSFYPLETCAIIQVF